MKYGAPIYRRCEHCEYAIEIHPLIEGSHRGSVLWSDGFIESTTMPEQAILARCDHCSAVVWLTDLEPVDNPETDRVTVYNELTPKDYLALVEDPRSLDKAHEVVLRTLAWQKGNDSRRGKEVPKAYSEAERRNMRELDDLLGEEEENELLLKIEIARELGDFQKAAKLMRNIAFSPQFTHFADQLKPLIAKKDSKVRAFTIVGLGAT